MKNIGAYINIEYTKKNTNLYIDINAGNSVRNAK